MSLKVENRGLAPVNKSFVSQHKKEILLVAGLVASAALGLLVSPDLGIGMGAVVFFTYLSADLLSPSTTPRKIQHQYDEWDVNRREAPTSSRRSSVSEAPKPIVEARREDPKRAAAKAARESARRENLNYVRPERPTKYANS